MRSAFNRSSVSKRNKRTVNRQLSKSQNQERDRRKAFCASSPPPAPEIELLQKAGNPSPRILVGIGTDCIGSAIAHRRSHPNSPTWCAGSPQHAPSSEEAGWLATPTYPEQTPPSSRHYVPLDVNERKQAQSQRQGEEKSAKNRWEPLCCSQQGQIRARLSSSTIHRHTPLAVLF